MIFNHDETIAPITTEEFDALRKAVQEAALTGYKISVNAPVAPTREDSGYIAEEAGRLLFDFLCHWFGGKSEIEFKAYVKKNYPPGYFISWEKPIVLLNGGTYCNSGMM